MFIYIILLVIIVIIVILSIQMFYISKRRYKYDVEWFAYDYNNKAINFDYKIMSEIELYYTSYEIYLTTSNFTIELRDDIKYICSNDIKVNKYSKSSRYIDNIAVISGNEIIWCNVIFSNDKMYIYFPQNLNKGKVVINKKTFIIGVDL